MHVMMMDQTDRLVYVETFAEGLGAYASGLKRENNPYKQGTVSSVGWGEGWDAAELDAKNEG